MQEFKTRLRDLKGNSERLERKYRTEARRQNAHRPEKEKELWKIAPEEKKARGCDEWKKSIRHQKPSRGTVEFFDSSFSLSITPPETHVQKISALAIGGKGETFGTEAGRTSVSTGCKGLGPYLERGKSRVH